MKNKSASLTLTAVLFLFSCFFAGDVLAAGKNGPVSCSITKIDDETSKTTIHEVPFEGEISSDARYELTIDTFGFRAAAPVREDASIHLMVRINDDQSAHASGVRGLTLLTFTGKTKDGLAHYDFRCK